MNKIAKRILAGAAALMLAPAAWAQDPVVGAPHPWQLGFQDAASATAERIHTLHDGLLYVIFAIAALVLLLLLWVIFRFRERANPTPSKTTHNTFVEVIWTVIPILILVAIAIPSYRLIYFGDRTPEPEMTLKIIGHQWYWSYEYPDQDNIAFDANLIADKDIQPGQLRLLETDNRVVLPVDTNIRLLVTADDVIHSFAMPAFGLKVDAIPGRLHESWVRITKEGVFYGQCSELCGIRHAYMPIVIEAVSKEKFAAWVAQKKASAANDVVPQGGQLAAAANN